MIQPLSCKTPSTTQHIKSPRLSIQSALTSKVVSMTSVFSSGSRRESVRFLGGSSNDSYLWKEDRSTDLSDLDEYGIESPTDKNYNDKSHKLLESNNSRLNITVTQMPALKEETQPSPK